MTDHELAQRCARGDREAQRLLYDRCGDRIFRLLYRMSRNNDDALDLAQETFVRVFERIGAFDGSSRLITWVYRIAINRALQFRRRERVKSRVLGNLAQRRRDALTVRAGEERKNALDALARLPEAARALLVLRYVEGMSYHDMATVLQKPPGSIASGLNRARQLLCQVLNVDCATGT